MEDPKMVKWLFGGTLASSRSIEFFAYASDGPGRDGVRCILKATRGSTAESSKIPYETKTSEGTGHTMEDAFSKAYEDLVSWLI